MKTSLFSSEKRHDSACVTSYRLFEPEPDGFTVPNSHDLFDSSRSSAASSLRTSRSAASSLHSPSPPQDDEPDPERARRLLRTLHAATSCLRSLFDMVADTTRHRLVLFAVCGLNCRYASCMFFFKLCTRCPAERRITMRLFVHCALEDRSPVKPLGSAAIRTITLPK